MISFIIPAYNEELLLPRTLRAIKQAGVAVGEPHEIIVVDDASTDRTAEIALSFGVRVIAVSHRQIAATRNAGARAANGEMLIFVDADTIVTRPVVARAVAALKAGAAGGGCAFQFDGRVPLLGRILELVATPVYRMLRLASGCFLFCSRKAFQAVGGFDERLFAAEEAALSLALGRHGRFVVLREGVITSGRKLRAHTARELLGLLLRLAAGGRPALRRRDGLDVWYGDRRPDPQPARPAGRSSPSLE